MARLRTALPALLLGLAAALALSSCGSGEDAELLPGTTASEISSNLEEVRRLAGEGECVGAQDAALAVSDQVDALGGVDDQLKRALREGANRLNEVVDACEEESFEEEETEPEPIETTEIEAEEEPEKGKKAEKKEPPGQEKKAEKEAEEVEEPETTTPTEPTTPVEPPAEPPAGDGGTPSGGVSPGAPTEGQ